MKYNYSSVPDEDDASPPAEDLIEGVGAEMSFAADLSSVIEMSLLP